MFRGGRGRGRGSGGSFGGDRGGGSFGRGRGGGSFGGDRGGGSFGRGRGGGSFGGGRGGGTGFKRPREGESSSGFRGGRGGGRGGGNFRPNYAGLGEASRGGARGANSDGFRPQVADDSVPNHTNSSSHTQQNSGSYPSNTLSRGRGFGPAGRGRGGPSGPAPAVPRPPTHVLKTRKDQRDVVVILDKAGLLLGYRGLVDAYERSATTELANESLKDVRPDIVHQCLLALFDSDLAYERRLRVYINLIARAGKVIEVSPALRPPRTYARFRGLMSALLREGSVSSAEGAVLMRLLPGSIAPVIPNGAEVIGLTNALSAPIETPLSLAKAAVAHPVDNALQGGVKNASAFYCIACTDDGDLGGIDYVSRAVCPSAYPITAHVMCARLCEGHSHVLEEAENGASE